MLKFHPIDAFSDLKVAVSTFCSDIIQPSRPYTTKSVPRFTNAPLGCGLTAADFSAAVTAADT